jgi:hypothetical protein
MTNTINNIDIDILEQLATIYAAADYSQTHTLNATLQPEAISALETYLELRAENSALDEEA